MIVWARLAFLGGHRRVRRLFVVALVVAGILFTFANPARTWQTQRQEIAAARDRTTVLEDQNQGLRQRTATLRTDAEVERLAREEYGLVNPGEEAFRILPPPGSVKAEPTSPPPPPKPRTFWQKTKDTLTFWD